LRLATGRQSWYCSNDGWYKVRNVRVRSTFRVVLYDGCDIGSWKLEIGDRLKEKRD